MSRASQSEERPRDPRILRGARYLFLPSASSATDSSATLQELGLVVRACHLSHCKVQSSKPAWEIECVCVSHLKTTVTGLSHTNRCACELCHCFELLLLLSFSPLEPCSGDEVLIKKLGLCLLSLRSSYGTLWDFQFIPWRSLGGEGSLPWAFISPSNS